MSKNLKKYNEVTRKWENISEPSSVEVIQVLDGEGQITDENIIVTNYNYSEGDDKTLNETLSVINDDISRLQRNVSWLAEHGGGGGSSGGGGGTPTGGYGIVVTSPILDNNAYYTSNSSITITFMVTGGTAANDFQYRVSLDGAFINNWASIANNTECTVNIENLTAYNSGSTHTVTISAKDIVGYAAVPVSFKIYESSLSLRVSDNKSINHYYNGEYIIYKRPNSTSAPLEILIKNGIIGAETTIIGEWGSKVVPMLQYINQQTNEIASSINIWDILEVGNVKPGELYNVKIKAQSVSSVISTSTEPIVLRLRIAASNELTVFLDGITYQSDFEQGEEETVFEDNAQFRYYFQVNVPTDVPNKKVYYAIGTREMTYNDSTGEWEYGEYIFQKEQYDFDTYTNGDTCTAGDKITVLLTPTYFLAGHMYETTVKAWSSTGELSAVTSGIFSVVVGDNTIFARQWKKRDGTDSQMNTCVAVFDPNSVYLHETHKLVSRVPQYRDFERTIHQNLESYLTTFGANETNVGRIVPPEGYPYLHLKNEVYACTDFNEGDSTVYGEISAMTVNSAYFTDGFTISLAFESDAASDPNRTIFFWGSNTADGTLSFGIKVTLERAIFKIYGEDGVHNASTSIVRGKRCTLDFVYDGNKILIYYNGIISAANEVGTLRNGDVSYSFPQQAYFACDVVNGVKTSFADVKIYSFAVYTKHLSPVQIAVNSKKDRITGNLTDPDVIRDYTEWKQSNLIYTLEGDDATPYSLLLLENNQDEFSCDSTTLSKILEITRIPVLSINAPGFTEDKFHQIVDKSATADTSNATAEYYDPNTRRTVSFNVTISLQGTSTLTYRVKNLEMVIIEDSETPGYPKLFQPKDTWFPERQFTLKADVVDSSHANNAVLGYWINSLPTSIMPENPPMSKMTDEFRPKDVVWDDAMNKIEKVHISTKDLITPINYHENVTIKRTLEGFPVLLFINFGDGEGGQGQFFKMIGIYSFNLGRFSYYNMGMKFLKSFSRRQKDSQDDDPGCPALVSYYEEYAPTESFNGLKGEDVFAFELGSGADDNDPAHPLWSQSDDTIIDHSGNFVYNAGSSEKVSFNDEIWRNLRALFNTTATMGGTSLSTRGFGPKQKYIHQPGGTEDDSGSWIPQGTYYENNDSSYNAFPVRFDVLNGAAYFTIVSAFGMVDSLGKNLTLRTWNKGEKWWPSFYDMDTALGLNNEGGQDVSYTAFIDSYTPFTQVNESVERGVTRHVQNGYVAYNSKLWAILRDPDLWYRIGQQYLYDRVWFNLRKNGGALATYSAFTNLMEEHIAGCGELVYNYDYNEKYLKSSADIGKLFGLRIAYVENWLRRRFYFLDGVFDWERNESVSDLVPSDFYDSSYHRDVAGMSLYCLPQGSTATGLRFRVKAAMPGFIRLNIGQSEGNTYKYYLPENQENFINYDAVTAKKQMTINGSTILSKFGNLNEYGVWEVKAEERGNLPSLVEFSLSGDTKLKKTPFVSVAKTFGQTGDSNSYLEKFDVSNSSLDPSSEDGNEGEVNFILNFKNFTKLTDINIANSPVISLTLPDSILKNLCISGSNLATFEMKDQPSLSALSFDNCTKIGTVSIQKCDSLAALRFDDLPNLTTLSVSDNQSISSITIDNCTGITAVTISNNPSLEEITISTGDFYENNFKVTILSCPSLRRLTINRVSATNAEIEMDYASANLIESFNVDNFYHFKGILYQGEDGYLTYKGENVADLSPMKHLETASFSRVEEMIYLKVHGPYDENENLLEPFQITDATVYGCPRLTRVFGYIEFSGNRFNRKTNFFLNDPDYVLADGTMYSDWHSTEIPLQNDEYFTNIKLGEGNFNECFIATQCSLGDVYYFFNKCHTGVTSLEKTFNACTNIVTTRENMLPPDLLHNCTNVTNYDGLFHGTNMGAPMSEGISGSLVPEEIISHITSHSISFSNVFPDGLYYIFENGFFNESAITETIEGFNPTRFTSFEDYENLTGDAEIWYFLPPDELLNNMEGVKVIKNSFNSDLSHSKGTKLYDEEGGEFDLLKGLTALTTIESSFNCQTLDHVKNLLCDPNSENNYSAVLRVIKNSFNFLRDDANVGAKMYFGDSMFKRCASNIQTIENSFNGEFLKVPDPDDCHGRGFPYEIFKGMSNVTAITGFFENFAFDSDATFEMEDEASYWSYNDSIPTVSLPSYINGNTRIDIFGDCTNLKNISNCFAKLRFGTFNLVGDGFANNHYLENVSSLFSQNEYLVDPLSVDVKEMAKMVGTIPYHFFYHGKDGNGTPYTNITNASSIFESCSSSTAITQYSFQDTYNTLGGNNASITTFMENGAWNKYMSDGTDSFKTIISSRADYSQYSPLPFPDELETADTKSIICCVLGAYDPNIYLGWEHLNFKNIFGKRNYMCAPDLLRYFKDNTRTSVDSVFMNASTSYDTQDDNVSGFRGTIPPFLFEPLSTQVMNAQGFFYGCRCIQPYKWANVDTDNQPMTYVSGTMYPPLFGGTNIKNVSSMFKYGNIWAYTNVESVDPANGKNVFANSVVNVSQLWANSQWGNGSRIANTIFINCSDIEDVSGMFSYNGGPVEMIIDLFSTSMSKIRNCSSFMYASGGITSGFVPVFWEPAYYPNMRVYSNAFHGVANSISNSGDIPESYKN